MYTKQQKAELERIYKKAVKGYEKVYPIDYFFEQIKDLRGDILKRNLVFGLKVSSSGMTRNWNSLRYNALLNILYNKKLSEPLNKPIKTSGCGMDMGWNMLYISACLIFSKKEIEDKHINSLCSSYSVL